MIGHFTRYGLIFFDVLMPIVVMFLIINVIVNVVIYMIWGPACIYIALKALGLIKEVRRMSIECQNFNAP